MTMTEHNQRPEHTSIRTIITLCRRKLLAHYRIICVVVGTLLFMQSLFVGFLDDDFYHQAILQEHADNSQSLSAWQVALQLWDWNGFPEFNPTRDGRDEYLHPGSAYALPWFRNPEFFVKFFRPIAAFSIMLNYKMGGSNPAIYQLFTLILWILLILVVISF